jgi:hypothetical protein
LLGSKELEGHPKKSAGQEILGGMLQHSLVTVTLKEHLLTFPQASVAMNSTLVVPTVNLEPEL